MDTWLIVALAAFAVVVIALLALARRRGNVKPLRGRELDPDQ
jgi:hypothetical protein